VNVAGDDDPDVLLSAYAGDGKVVVVAINKGAAAADFDITITGAALPVTMTPHVTSAADNLTAGAALPVTDGVVSVSLAAKTVTTFVGE
jgi:glucuronoarabinoxylan endo-1,4-beta-xylanase